jgi:hypothetical protein
MNLLPSFSAKDVVWRRQQVPPKCRHQPTKRNGITANKRFILKLTAVRTPYMTA